LYRLISFSSPQNSHEILDFEVTAALPNVTGPIARSFAGNVGVNRANHPNATLFFWAFEKANGTLTDSASDTDPWIIWLNGDGFRRRKARL
jgi:hypothetical protein